MEDYDDSAPETEPIEGVFSDLFAAEIIPPRWVLHETLPVGLTFVAADPKALKSTLLLAMSLEVAGYNCRALPPWLRKVDRAGTVMMFSAEAEAGELRHTVNTGFGVQGEAREAVLVADSPWLFMLDDEAGRRQLIDWMEIKHPKLVVLDPFRNFHGLDENDSTIVKCMAPLRQWAVRNEAAFVVVHHTKKPSTEGKLAVRDVHDMRGTSALFGACDGVLMLSKQGENLHLQGTFKRGRPWARTFTFGAFENVGQPGVEILDDFDRQVLEIIRKRPSGMKRLVRDAGSPIMTVRATVEKLWRNECIEKVDGRWKVK